MKPYEQRTFKEFLREICDEECAPKSFKEALVMWLLVLLFFGAIEAGAFFGGYFWILPVIGVPASLYGMWRVGGWK